MSKETVSPKGEDFNRVVDAHAKAHIAGIVGVICLGVTPFFPPAIGGFFVGFGEAARQGKRMFSRMGAFDQKYRSGE